MSQIKSPFAHKFTSKMPKMRIIQTECPCGMEWATVTGHRMQINLWTAAASGSFHRPVSTFCIFKSKLRMVEPGGVPSSPVAVQLKSLGLKLDRNHQISHRSPATIPARGGAATNLIAPIPALIAHTRARMASFGRRNVLIKYLNYSYSYSNSYIVDAPHRSFITRISLESAKFKDAARMARTSTSYPIRGPASQDIEHFLV